MSLLVGWLVGCLLGFRVPVVSSPFHTGRAVPHHLGSTLRTYAPYLSKIFYTITSPPALYCTPALCTTHHCCITAAPWSGTSNPRVERGVFPSFSLLCPSLRPPSLPPSYVPPKPAHRRRGCSCRGGIVCLFLRIISLLGAESWSASETHLPNRPRQQCRRLAQPNQTRKLVCG